MLKCECGFRMERPGYPLYCRCGRIHHKNGIVVDALASNQPGTELARIFSSLGVAEKTDCGCIDRAQQMNAWGVSGCIEHHDTIVGWMREKVLLPKVLLSVVLNLAIYRARKAAS